jgi:hypothetical protein
LLAAPYLPFLLGIDVGHGLLGALFVCAAALLSPAAAGLLVPGGDAPARRFARAFASAAALNIIGAVVLKILSISPTSKSFAAVLLIETVLVAAWGRSRGGRLPRAHASIGAVAGAAFLLAFLSGTRVVPPLEDQDMEIQGTAYGLAHDLEPICATNRSTLYWFAHPLLHHAFVASTLIFAGELEIIRPAYDLAVRKLDELEEAERARGLRAIARAFRNPTLHSDIDFEWFHEVYKAFLARPALFGTRAPNFAFAGAVAVLLYVWMFELGLSRRDAALVTAVYATLPEIFVRSGYGGYYAATSATFVAGTWLASRASGGGRAAFSLGFLGALTNQKVGIIAVAVAAYRMAQKLWDRSFPVARAAAPYLAGIVLGTAAFAAWGLWLFPGDFLVDHLLEHGVRRFTFAEFTSRGGEVIYPSRLAVWQEFGAHMGWIWTALAFVAFLRSFRETRSPIGLVTAWGAVGAVAFTAMDWRQTKHLCLLVPAFTLLIARLLAVAASLGPLAARVLRALLLASLLWNGWWIVKLSQDFSSLTMSTIW